MKTENDDLDTFYEIHELIKKWNEREIPIETALASLFGAIALQVAYSKDIRVDAFENFVEGIFDDKTIKATKTAAYNQKTYQTLLRSLQERN